MILPPDMTRKLLAAQNTGAFDALMRNLGIVVGAANRIAASPSASGTRNTIGSQHNGDVFYINGELAEYVTSGTTMGQLADLARNLGLRKGC